ncbi:hypothetical protein ACFQ0P_08195 [Microbacterium insulae]|uniref:Uncharacterized protein n=1 Tax=Microbacterium insulae TaxID=483014 RepID=A0ABW3AHC4_9MICO
MSSVAGLLLLTGTAIAVVSLIVADAAPTPLEDSQALSGGAG